MIELEFLRNRAMILNMDSYRKLPSINDSTTIIKDKGNIVLKWFKKINDMDVLDFFIFSASVFLLFFGPFLCFMMYLEYKNPSPKSDKNKTVCECVCPQPERAACEYPDDQKKVEKE